MPVHDWTKVEAGIFHDFHQGWAVEISSALNASLLPPGFFALIVTDSMRDLVALSRHPAPAGQISPGGGVAVADAPPQARFVTSVEPDLYAHRANRIAIKHRLGRVVAVIEIVSPGNKSSQHAVRAFVLKAEELLRDGVNLLIVDLFPPSPRDPQGIHKAIWDQFREEPFELPPGKPLTVAAYSAGVPQTAYVEPVGVGDPLPALPIFLDPGTYVPAPLETTYQTTWAKCPEVVRELVGPPTTS